MLTKTELLRNVYIKLDSMPLAFGLPQYDINMSDAEVEKYLGTDYTDARREFNISATADLGTVIQDERTEYIYETRILYHALRRFRLSSSVYFKFSTATDGKTVDKSMIPKMITEIINGYDREYKQWKRTYKNVGGTWTIASTVATSGDI